MDTERWRRISLLYHQALAHTTEARRAFIASACGDDAVLRHELESLLDSGTGVDDGLLVSEISGNQDQSSAEGDSTIAKPGTMLGSYRIERLLGRGGMATVFLAQDLKHRRTVAIKILRPEFAAAIGAVRFLREIEIAAQLVHPHILPFFDSGAVGDQLYYVMPYVEGGSLRARLQRDTPLAVEEALRLAREIASALGHAHRQGFIHRDIKPENILLLDGMALVADFGIARVMSSSAAETLTGTGAVLGTPLYMSPEQAFDTGDVGAPADLYSLACVLYEMLAGAPPFTGPSAMTVLLQHAAQAVPPLRGKRPEIPEGLERAIEKALAKAPGNRYATAAQFIEALTAGTIVDCRSRRQGRTCANRPDSHVGEERRGRVDGGGDCHPRPGLPSDQQPGVCGETGCRQRSSGSRSSAGGSRRHRPVGSRPLRRSARPLGERYRTLPLRKVSSR